VVVFVCPVELDLMMFEEILGLFHRTTGLVANLSKSKVFPIRCSPEQLGLIASTLGCQMTEFPCPGFEQVPLLWLVGTS
jgi:hypothetical protein